MTRLEVALIAVLAAAPAFGQEFTLPEFTAADAGVPEPSPPPPPPLDANPAPKPQGPPPPPRWNRIAGSVGALVAGNAQVYLGGELTLLGELGTVKPAPEAGEIEGWLFLAGVNANYGRVHGAVCRGATFCAERFAGGLALKSGWARGRSGTDGSTKANLMFYGQLDVLASYYALPSAPLAPGVSAWELLMRLRLGVHWSRLGATAAKSNLTANVAFVVEGIPTRVNRGVSFGVVAGIAF